MRVWDGNGGAWFGESGCDLSSVEFDACDGVVGVGDGD